MKGRKPKPTHLKMLAGNPGKRPLPQNEPQYREISLELPEELSDPRDSVSAAEWNRVVPQLVESGVAKRVDRTALIAYCLTYQKWIMAENSIREHGFFVRSKTGWVNMNPNVKVAEKFLTQLRSLMGDFGLTPSSRVRLKADIPVKDYDPLDEFLNAAR